MIDSTCKTVLNLLDEIYLRLKTEVQRVTVVELGVDRGSNCVVLAVFESS